MDNKIIFLGYSGHAYSVIDAAVANNCKILGYCDFNENSKNPFGIKYLGYEKELLGEQKELFFPSVGDNLLREKIITFIESKHWNQTTIIHPSSIISSRATIGASVFISSGVIINAIAHISKGCIINSGALIEHECEIGAYCHIAPGATIAGDVKIGARSFIGANATIIPGITIGNNVTIGAGTIVIKDIPDGVTCVGNPARIIKQ